MNFTRKVKAAALVVILTATGCFREDSEKHREFGSLSFDEHINPILQRQVCRACHYGAELPEGSEPVDLFPYGFNLHEAMAYENLVNVRSFQQPDLFRVKPGEPENSYLLIKFSQSNPMRRGSVMVLGEEQIDSIRAWIEQGAIR